MKLLMILRQVKETSYIICQFIILMLATIADRKKRNFQEKFCAGTVRNHFVFTDGLILLKVGTLFVQEIGL